MKMVHIIIIIYILSALESPAEKIDQLLTKSFHIEPLKHIL